MTALEFHKQFNNDFDKMLNKRSGKAKAALRVKLKADLIKLNEMRLNEGYQRINLPHFENN